MIVGDLETGEEVRRVQLPSMGGLVFILDFKIDPERNRALILRTTPITGELLLSEVDLTIFSIDELISWTQDNRYIRDFGPSECLRYRVPDPCGQEE